MKISSSRPLRRTNGIVLGAVALVLLAIISLSYREWRRYNSANATASQTRKISASIDQLLASLTDAETGERGYLLTGDSRFLQPYDSALQAIPSELSALMNQLAGRGNESANMAQLASFVGQRVAAFRQTIQQRRNGGTVSDARLDENKRVMDQIRAVCSRIQTSENSAITQASAEGEAAAATTLLATILASLALFFLFAIAQAPAIRSVGSENARLWPLRYGVAVAAAAAAFVLRASLTPLIGPIELAFGIDLAAVLFSAWFGGLGSGLLCIVVSGVASAYYFEPVGSFLITNRRDQISLLIFVVLGFGIALLADSQRRAVERAVRAEDAEHVERQRFQTTLESIGDAVIATDAQGRVTFANKIALALLRWPAAEISGKPLDEAFRIVNEYTRATVDSPVARVLREGIIVGLANHTILIGRDGTETPIDDSAAPIRNEDGAIQGTVLVFRDISARHQAERTARLLASIVESSDDAIISRDLNGLVTSWNEGAEKIFGYSAAEMTGQPIAALAPLDRAQEIREIFERIRQGEHVNQYRTIRQKKDGTLIHVSFTISPIHDGAGRIVGASNIVRDITAEIEAQRAIAEQRERLRVTLSSIGDAVITTDTEGRVTYLNPVAEELTGWTNQEAAGIPLHEVFRIIAEETRETAANPVTRVLREGRAVGLANHTLLISKQGREFSIDDSAAPILDAQNQIVGVVLVFRDITEKRAAEEALRKEEERLALMLKHLPLGVGVVDGSGDILVSNPAWRQLLRSQAGWADDSKWTAAIAEPDPVKRALGGEEVIPGVDFLLRHDTDAERWMRLSAVPLRDSRGQITSALAMLQDIDDARRAEDQRAELLAKDRALNAEKALREIEGELARVVRALSVGELATSIAHEINQPLAGVVTNAEAGLRWLSGDPPNIEEARQSLSLVARDGNRASQVIRRIREFLKKDSPQTASLDLSEVIQEALALTRGELIKRGIELHVQLPGGLPRVRGDRVQLQQVILNLVMNAAEAMAYVEPPNDLLVSAQASADGLITVAVRDSGAGISPQDMLRMFDALFTTKSEGMGMGLSISRSIVENHGGQMLAASNEGPGITVRFTLPAEAASHAASNQG